MDIREEVSKMLDDICGELLENTPDKAAKKEDIKRKYVDLVTFIREYLSVYNVPDYQLKLLEYLAEDIEERNKFKSEKVKCRCGINYSLHMEPYRMEYFNYSLNETSITTNITRDYFYCMNCGTRFELYGKLLKVISDNSKYEVEK